MKVQDIELKIDESSSQSFIMSGCRFNPRITFAKNHMLIITTDVDEILLVPLSRLKAPGTRLTKKKLNKILGNLVQICDNLENEEFTDSDLIQLEITDYLINGEPVVHATGLRTLDWTSDIFNKLYVEVNKIIN